MNHTVAIVTILVLALVPLLLAGLRPWIKKQPPARREIILGAVKGAVDVLTVVAPITPTDLDNAVLAGLKQIQAEAELKTEEERVLARNMFVAAVCRKGVTPEVAVRAHEIASERGSK